VLALTEKIALTGVEREAITREASRILNSAPFKTSDRCRKLFQYLVDEALSENQQPLKERRVGHEVFGREPGYDTAADPIVRNVASEVRKRLRQHYLETNAPPEIHIELASGTYMLAFQFVHSEELKVPAGPHGKSPVDPVFPGPAMSPKVQTGWRLLWVPYGVAILAVMLCGGLTLAFMRHLSRSNDGQAADSPASTPFWQPVIASKKEIFISLGHGLPSAGGNPTPDSGGLQRITMTDLKAYANLSGLLEVNGHPFQMRPDTMTKIADLKDRPVILIGNVNNVWVLRLTPNLRFRYEWDRQNPGVTIRIRDSMHSGAVVGEVQMGKDLPPPQVDYAIAERFRDPTTGDIVVCVAGAGAVGTEAASVFLTQKKYLDTLPKSLSNPDTNIQVLLKTNIVDGTPGPPEVITVHTW
jgi:hypothetical protein